jgi:uncharacterized membrane protein
MLPIQLIKALRLRPVVLIFLFSLVCLGMLSLRLVWSEQYRYLSLGWNLFLAWIPLLIALRLRTQMLTGSYNRLYYLSGLLLWLLFLPNAPYIITDLLHLQVNTGVPIWFDSILIFSFAMGGLQTGLYSMYVAHQIINRLWNERVGWLAIAFSVLLSSFGIFLGRFQRWNSWDVFTNPVRLVTDCLQQTTNPMAVKMTLAFTCLLLCFYLLFVSLIHLKMYESTPRYKE